jgi:hypothetical protein
MAATTSQLNALANDSVFRARARTLVLQICAQVYGEDAQTPNHSARASYAVKLLQSPGLADQLVQVLVTRTNLAASTVTYDFDKGEVLTDASDAAILSQIATDFSMLAGV